MWSGKWAFWSSQDPGSSLQQKGSPSKKDLTAKLTNGRWTSGQKVETTVARASWHPDDCDRPNEEDAHLSETCFVTPLPSCSPSIALSNYHFPSFNFDTEPLEPESPFSSVLKSPKIPVRMTEHRVLPSTIHGIINSDSGLHVPDGSNKPELQRGDSTSTTSPPVPDHFPSTSGSGESWTFGAFWEKTVTTCMLPLTTMLSKKQHSADSWEIPFERIQDLQWLGSGAQGAVFLGKYNGTSVAVKKVKSLAEVREVEPLRKINHPNLVAFKGICTQPPCYCLIMEYCQYGPLYDLIQEDKKIPPSLVAVWSHQIASGMTHLHANKIIHRDLKSPNVLVCNTHLVKISDFGTIRPWAEDQKSMQMSFAGTVAWMAPEVIRNEPCTEKIDVWAFGVILWELLVGLHPYPGLDSTSIIWGVGSEKLLGLPVPVSIPDGFKLLLTQCWSGKPRNRPSFIHILSHLQIAASEITTMSDLQFYTHQAEWKEHTHSEIKNFRIKNGQSTTFNKEKVHQKRLRKKELMLADGFSDELYLLQKRRKEELKHAEEVRIHYEKKLERVNKLYLELTTCTLQLEEREKELRRREKLVEKALGKSQAEKKSRRRILDSVKKAGLELLKPHSSVPIEHRYVHPEVQRQKSATLPMDYAIWTAENSEGAVTEDHMDDEDKFGEDVLDNPIKGTESGKYRHPLMSMRSRSAESIDPVGSLRSVSQPKLSPDLFRGLPKRTPSDSLGYIFRSSVRKDFSCQCSIPTEDHHADLAKTSDQATDVIEETSRHYKELPEVPSTSAAQEAISNTSQVARSSSRARLSSEGTFSEGLSDVATDDSESEREEDQESLDPERTTHPRSVFQSDESLQGNLNPSQQMYRDIIVRRSKELERKTEEKPVEERHGSLPDLQDAALDPPDQDLRRASTSQASNNDLQRTLSYMYSKMPESNV
ncbi:hypothetical protein RvY_05660 [Ramazzottius varieornatus]|uniref:Protein kinase domain-containing protein n=1 Tax=Ramazzottius varieornatus TaxID=947166 RepID=A0A1D1V4S8_RAMVA|nr:hypothetical protein RvY_05660 [Ramazzottius varieornatus]